jgi:anti-sigma regulatory factor (Ser/Thr protein kinase)
MAAQAPEESNGLPLGVDPDVLDSEPAPVLADVAPPPVGADRNHRRQHALEADGPEAAPRAGRRHVRGACADWGVDDDLCDVVILLTSELVTNAARHAPPPIELHVELGPRGVMVSCTDSTATPPQQQRPDLETDGGRGIFLIEMLASAWGYELLGPQEEPTHKRVWFLVDTAPPRREPTSGPPG